MKYRKCINILKEKYTKNYDPRERNKTKRKNERFYITYRVFLFHI